MAVNPTMVFTGPRRVEIEDRPVPKPGPHELLIRTHVSLISTGTELSALDGDTPCGEIWQSFRKYPFVPGYSNVGSVIDVGEGVEKDWIGKRVTSSAVHAAYAVVGRSNCREIGRGVGDEEATFIGLAFVALNGVRRSRLVFGEAAVVYGLGIIGQITVQLCQFAGARPVFGVDLGELRVRTLPERPGIIAVPAGDVEVKDVVKTATNGRMADVVFEVTGNPDVIPREFEVLRPQGRCVILSSPRAATLFDFHDLCNGPSFTIIGAHNYSHPRCATGDNPWTWDRHGEMFFELVAAGELDISRLVSHREPFENAPGLYEMLLDDRSRALGVILNWSDSKCSPPSQ